LTVAGVVEAEPTEPTGVETDRTPILDIS
jgi:hypothetical protein